MNPVFMIGVLNNITLLLALGFMYSVSIRRWDTDTVKGKVIVGLLFGGFAVVGMLFPVQYSPGLIFDGRTILLGIVGFFGGWIAAVIAAVLTIALRIWQGGVGTLMGVATILSAAGIGVLFHLYRPRFAGSTRLRGLYGFGLIIHIAMLACTSFLPEAFRWQVLSDIAAPVLLLYRLEPCCTGGLSLSLNGEILP